MKFQTDGLILREMSIGESDRLLYILTGSDGVIKAFAKGAKSIKSGKCAPTSLLSYSRLTVYKTRDSFNIGDARSLRIFSRLRSDVRKMCLAQYFCELAMTVCPREAPAEKQLRLILNSLYLLSESKRDERLIKACLEMRLTAMAGYTPDLLMCGSCGAYTAPTMFFVPASGRLECADCGGARNKGAVPLGAAALTALRHTVYADDDRLFSFSLSDEGLDALNTASESYIKYRFEKDFKTLAFYKTVAG